MTLKQMTNDSGAPLSSYKERWEDVQNRVKEIFEAAGKWALDTGEVQILVLKQFGKRIENIDEGNFSQIVKWFSVNGFRVIQLLSPDMHNELIKTNNEYTAWFKRNDVYTQQQPHYAD
jgi:hypothetical protein